VPLDQFRVTPGRFDGRTVIVAGAASGIGRATASRVARALGVTANTGFAVSYGTGPGGAVGLIAEVRQRGTTAAGTGVVGFSRFDAPDAEQPE
jgi:NAD(P)-dependent dehydrogenase (short-subunit alcohol dehydrogenase family)